MMRLICDYHIINPDQRESMSCPDCNRCVDCGKTYYDDDLLDCGLDPGDDVCPYCERMIIDYTCPDCGLQEHIMDRGEEKITLRCRKCGYVSTIESDDYVRLV